MLFSSLIVWIIFADYHPYGDSCKTAINDCETMCCPSNHNNNGLKNVLCPVYVRDVDAGFPSVALTLKASLHLSTAAPMQWLSCTTAVGAEAAIGSAGTTTTTITTTEGQQLGPELYF